MKIKIIYTEQNESNTTINIHNYIGLYLFGIRIKKIEIGDKIKSKKSKDSKINTSDMLINQAKIIWKNRDILDEINKMILTTKFHKLHLSVGVNLDDPIYNAYIIALINSIIPTVLSIHSKNINMNKMEYETFISEKTLYFKIDSIIYFPIVKNIHRIIKIIFFMIKKGGIKNGNKTSNRISNDNINDLNRKYD